MAENHFLIRGPALISFSGGRSSAMMLHNIVEAHGGALPDDVIVVFANTGKEKPQTLRFVAECGIRWGVRIRWVEYRQGGAGFTEVEPNSASREGEPFEALINHKQALPNGRERWCTQFLKVMPMFALMRAELGLEPGSYNEAIGYRNDEGLRILTGMEKAAKNGRRITYPLAKAKISKPEVLAFWRAQPFYLALKTWQGNCTLCFAKGKAIRKRIIRDDSAEAYWWRDMEVAQGRTFATRESVQELIDAVAREPLLFDDNSLDDEWDDECGDGCGVAA